MAIAGGGRGRVEEVDRHVARRVRERRVALGLTQGELADRLGVTYQQTHKYEAGVNRITAGRLHAVAEVLGVGVGHFYEGLGTAAAPGPGGRRRAGLELARSFLAIAEPRQQAALLALARALTDWDEAAPDSAEGRAGLAAPP